MGQAWGKMTFCERIQPVGLLLWRGASGASSGHSLHMYENLGLFFAFRKESVYLAPLAPQCI